MYDNKRDTYNVTIKLFPNTNAAENTDTANIDFLSNGFKLRRNEGEVMHLVNIHLHGICRSTSSRFKQCTMYSKVIK